MQISRRRALTAALTASLLGRRAFAQIRTEVREAEQQLYNEGRYMPYLMGLRAEAAKEAQSDGIYFQILSQFSASVGDEPRALRPVSARPLPPEKLREIAEASAEDAIKAIVRRARGRRVVILNEAHHVSRCRAFGAQVATALAAQGFNVFAAETFTTNPAKRFRERTATPGPFTLDLGYYTADPVFSELARAARANGMRLVDYEQRPDQTPPPPPASTPAFVDPSTPQGRAQIAAQNASVELREEAESDNLATILRQDPKARILVYCGYSHAAKTPQRLANGERSWMAAKLKAKTGLDPLSINQADQTTYPTPVGENPAVTALLQHFSPRAPIVVSAADGAALTVGSGSNFDRAAFDLAVYHPRTAQVAGRPGWLAAQPGRKTVVFKLKAPAPVEALIQAMPPGPVNVAPADHYLIPAGSTEATFILRPGAYSIRFETIEGRRDLGMLKV